MRLNSIMNMQLRTANLGLFLTLGLSACNGLSANNPGGKVLGTDDVVGSSQPIPETPTTVNPPNNNPTTPTDGSSSAQIGPTCHSSDTNKLCLSLKYVVYKNSNDVPTISQTQAIKNINDINALWKACNIAFEIGEYLAVDPTEISLDYNTANINELDNIRNDYDDPNMLLVVTTGAWSGSLGAGGANAWTQMPGSGPYGVVLESPVGDYGNIIAHELGHYLNLDHVSNSANVMNPIIYDSSTALSTSQCTAARSASNYFWKAMLR